MNEYWVFFFPSGPHDRAAAIEGHVLCPMVPVSAPSDEAVMEAFPHACRICRLGSNGGWVFIATATTTAAA